MSGNVPVRCFWKKHSPVWPPGHRTSVSGRFDDVRQNPIGDAFVVFGQVLLGETVVGIEHAIGMREANAGDGGFVSGAFRRSDATVFDLVEALPFRAGFSLAFLRETSAFRGRPPSRAYLRAGLGTTDAASGRRMSIR